jgi:hypothetical protein
MAHTADFRTALAELTSEELAQKAKEARLVAIVSVRLYDNTEYATQTEVFDGNLVHHMNLFYESICGKPWNEVVGARFNEKFYRWTVTHGLGYYWMDSILGGNGDGTVIQTLKESAGIVIY